MTLALALHDLLRQRCPIHGVSIGDPSDKATWRIDFAAGATEAQKKAARDALAAFDAAAAEAAAEKTRALAASDAGFLRVLEDLVEALLAKKVIAAADLPAEARARLAARKALRDDLTQLPEVTLGLDDPDSLFAVAGRSLKPA